MKVSRHKPWTGIDINECDVCLRCWYDDGKRADKINPLERDFDSLVRIHPVLCDDCLWMGPIEVESPICLSSTPKVKGNQIETRKTQPITKGDSQILSGQEVDNLSQRSSAGKAGKPNRRRSWWWKLWNKGEDNQND